MSKFLINGEEIDEDKFPQPYSRAYVDEKDKEITRLNNIINELEKCIKEEYDYCDRRKDPAFGVGMGVSTRILNKLKELKVGDKE